MMNLCKEWLIYGKPNQDEYGDPIKGAINNGYTEKELLDFWHDLEGYASYLFNKSHATSYSLITIITAYLKYYFPTEFYAAVLTYEKDEEKRKIHMDAAKKDFNITVEVPSINNIKEEFYPNVKDKIIYFGLNGINGIGDTVYSSLIKNAPYSGVEDAIEKLSNKEFNKKIAEATILSGLFDFESKDRADLLNRFYDIKKSKAEKINKLTKREIIKYETKYLGTAFSCTPWIDSYNDGDMIRNICVKIKNVQERIDKKGGLMAFVNVDDLSEEVDKLSLVVFSSVYRKYISEFDTVFGEYIEINGKKDGNKIIVSSARKIDVS